jgi:hypothetical protein
MPFIHGKNAQVLHGAYDLSGYFNDASISQSVETAETTTFSASGSAKTFITGLRDATISLSGLFDGAVGAVDPVVVASIGSDTLSPVTVAPAGITLGGTVYIGLAKTTGFEISAPVGDVVSASYDGQFDGGVDDGKSLTTLASVAVSTNHTGVDGTAATTNGGIAQLHVTTNTRSTTSTFKVQHSSDNSTFADLATFTNVLTTVITSEKVAVASGTTVNRYLRAQSTYTAGTGAATYQISFARR